MIHYVKPHDPVGSQFACGLWSLENQSEQVTTRQSAVTCPKCKAHIERQRLHDEGVRLGLHPPVPPKHKPVA